MDTRGEKGRGTWLFLHGAALDARVWAPWRARLGGRALDLPGRGARAAVEADVGAFAAALSPEVPADAVVVGHSMGGAVAMELALRRPLAGLVLVATGARLRVSPAILDHVADAAARGVVARLIGGLWGPEAPVELQTLFAESEASVSPDSALADWRAADRFDRRTQLAQLRVPTLVIGGDDDALTPPRYAQWLADTLPQSTILRLPGGHLAAWEELELTVAHVRRWAAQCNINLDLR